MIIITYGLSLSSAKLVVTTLPRSAPGSGQVLVETARGGTSPSNLSFTYVVDKETTAPVENNQFKFMKLESSRKAQSGM